MEEVRKFVVGTGGQKRPSRTGKTRKEKFLAKWINHQRSNYMNSDSIMKDASIRKEWDTFVETYAGLFDSNVKSWRRTCNEVRRFFDAVGGRRKPSQNSQDEYEKSLAHWMKSQESKYFKYQGIMKNDDIRREWEALVIELEIVFPQSTENRLGQL
eukprot:2860512-Pleurochrysis_carterae.AAC.1